MNMPLRAASSCSAEGAAAASLDHCGEEDKEDGSFHQFHHRRVQQSSMHKQTATPPHQVICSSPTKNIPIDPMWQITRWLQNCEAGLGNEELSWWPLVSPLTDGIDATTKELPWQLMAAWKWAGAVSKTSVCLPTPTILNIGQFLDEDLTGHGWSMQQWLLAYPHALQHVGEAADGRTWRPNGRHFTLQISLLVDAFLEVTNAEVMEADVACCWSEPPKTFPLQRDKGAFAHVISYLDNLAQCLPTRKAWDELVCPPSSAVPHTPCWSGHLGYIQG